LLNRALRAFGRSIRDPLPPSPYLAIDGDLQARLDAGNRPAATARSLELTDPPVYAAINRLEEAGILREVTGRQRGRIFVYDQYLALLNEGT
jgi:hypothetical protein